MPSVRTGSRGRDAISYWRVKCGKHEVYVSKVGKKDCAEWVRRHQADYDQKLRVVPPNA